MVVVNIQEIMDWFWTQREPCAILTRLRYLNVHYRHYCRVLHLQRHSPTGSRHSASDTQIVSEELTVVVFCLDALTLKVYIPFASREFAGMNSFRPASQQLSLAVDQAYTPL